MMASGRLLVTVMMALAAAGCGGADGPVRADAAVVDASIDTSTTDVSAVMGGPDGSAPVAAVTTLVEPTTSVGDVSDDVGSTTTTVPPGCELAPAGSLLEARRTPASPYLVHQPAEAGPDTPTVMFIPGGTSGLRRAGQRVWSNYLSEGDGVDDFRIVIPYADDFDLDDDQDRLLAIVDEVLACFGGDPSKFHIAGYSKGGQIAFDLMLRTGLFASALGAPGEFQTIDPESWSVGLAGKAVFNGVGEDDSEWFGPVNATHEGLLEAGIESVYVEFPGDGHRLSPEFDESVFFDFWASH